MDGTIQLTAEESCEAVRSYLVLRGALPAHGKVLRVEGAEQQHYSGSHGVSATVEIGEPPAPSVPAGPEGGQGA